MLAGHRKSRYKEGMLKFFRKHGRPLLVVLLALAAMGGGVAVRRSVLDAQRELLPDAPLPFTLESALAFRRVQLVYRDGALPQHDAGIQYPEGIHPGETDTVGAERFYAAAARVWPGTLSLMEKIRWLQLLWFALTIPAIFCWVRWLGGGTAGGLTAACLYAVSICAVARSTGQNMMHENNALPLVAWHLAFGARALMGNFTTWKRRGLYLLSAGLLALAWCAWDLVQLYIGLLLLFGLVSLLVSRAPENRRRLAERFLPIFLCIGVAVFANPYLRSHQFFSAPDSYNHFAALFWAKLRFLNQRPADPALLTFAQRILWTPALHSTTWPMVHQWLPYILPAGILALLSLLPMIGKKAVNLPIIGKSGFRGAVVELAGMTLIFFCGFILFFRLHVWLAVFLCGLIGLVVGLCWARGGVWRWGAAVLAAAVVVLEGTHTLGDPLRWGSSTGYLPEMREMTDYLRERLAPEPVLANFGVSGSIAAYGGCPVVLHPKFETQALRDKVREYGEHLFGGTEEDFRDWMIANDTVLYIHSFGEFASIQPGYQMRYMVNRLQPANDAAARLFEQRPGELKHFVRLFANRKYAVYRVAAHPVAEAHAGVHAGQAQQAFEEGRLFAAAAAANRALLLWPGHAAASVVWEHTVNLLEKNFPSQDFPEDAEPPAFAPTVWPPVMAADEG